MWAAKGTFLGKITPPPLARKARLDRTYVLGALANAFIRSSASTNYTTCASDHYPIVTKLDDKESKVCANWFHTDPQLFKLPCVQEAISRIWKWEGNLSPTAKWSSAVKDTQTMLIQVKKEATMIRKRKQEKLYAELAVLEGKGHMLSGEEMKAVQALRSSIQRTEETQAKQLQCFLKGWWRETEDRPVKEIFKTLKRKQVQEAVPLLTKKDGSRAGSSKENLGIVQDHFARLFARPHAPSEEKLAALQEIERCRNLVVTEFLAKDLESTFEEVEVREAIKALKGGKSPGLDGLPVEFYQSFMEVLVQPLLDVWEEVVEHQALPFSLNTGVIKLLYKKGEKDQLGNWQPITMLPTAYKIYAKILARRLGKHLDKWIHKEQKGFVQGRYILDAIITMWEGIEHAQETKQDFYFLKIDFDKAYDRIEWRFIESSLKSMGLRSRFIGYVCTLFGHARSRVAVNGELSQAFDLHRSIRQGCPLAPLLYAIASDGLSCLVNNRIESGQLKGISLSDQEKICMQLFADDTNALIKNEEASLKCFWNCLDTYCLASGSQINHQKAGVKTYIADTPRWLLE